MKRKILFFGTPDIAVPSLEKLVTLPEIEIVGVGVFPDKKVGRKQILTPCPVKYTAQKLNLNLFEIANKKDLRHIFKTQSFDMGLVIAFGMIFPADILDIPEYGVVNVHFSLLPQYRGASPVQSAILNGNKLSGITFQRMEKTLDAGDILYQKEFVIKGKKTSEVFTDFAQKSADMLPTFLGEYFADQWHTKKQSEAQATFCTKFAKSDGEVFPKKESAEAIYRKYLAFDIFPGIFLCTEKGNIKLTEISLQKMPHSIPIKCANSSVIYILRAQISGKKEMDAAAILRGNREIFENY